MKIRRIRKKSKKHFVKRFFHEKTFFLKKTFFFHLFFHRSNLRFSAEDIFLRPRATRRMRGGTADMAHQSTGLQTRFTERSNARFCSNLVPRDEKNCCLSSFYFSGPTWKNAFLRRDAPVVGPGGTLEGTRGYLVSICRRDAPVEGRGHTSKGIQRGGAPRKGWRTPPAPPGVAHPVRGGAPLAWRTPPGVPHPVRGGAPRTGWRTP